MFAVGMVIGAVVALIVALLAVPVMLTLDAQRVETFEANWRVRWLFGLVDARSTRQRRKRSLPARPEALASGKISAGERRRGGRMGIAVVRTCGSLRRTARLVVTLFRQVRFEEICVHTMFGLEDPADTGMVYGFLTPVLAAARARRLDVDCRPMFTETGWKGSVRATIRVRPLSLLAVLAVFLVSPPVIRALEVAWHSRK